MRGIWLEATLNDLYNQSVDGFPTTKRRQFSTDTIKIDHLEWVPFLGMNTLFVKGTVNNEGRKNEAIMVFEDVKYHEKEGKGVVSLVASNGKTVYLEPLSSASNDVKVRCSCKDFYWRFLHFNKEEKALFGRDRAPYDPVTDRAPANPTETAGLCKHLMKLAKILKEAHILL